jgi:glyoxylase-like metal-dependent hydrolase (beta-lactamase superfamily II)
VISHYHADHIYGLQAFREHGGNPPVWAQQLGLGYIGGDAASQGEDAQRRLAQRREALFPWVDEHTYLVAPDRTFDKELQFELGGVTFEIRHTGPAHAPGDSIMLVRDHGVLFSGDVVYKGRVPFLDSPETDTKHWLAGLDALTSMSPQPGFIVPGHGEPSTDVAEAVDLTRNYITYVRDVMSKAVEDFTAFDEAYRNADWSPYSELPAFHASNRGNAFRIFLELEAASFD